MANISALDRLKTQLHISGISQQNQSLFQVIDELINFLRQSINLTQSQVNALNIATSPTITIPSIITQGQSIYPSDVLDDFITEPIFQQGLIFNNGLFTPGSIIFAGINGLLSQNNINLFWDNINSRFGLATTLPATLLDVNGNATFRGFVNVTNGQLTLGGWFSGTALISAGATSTSPSAIQRGLEMANLTISSSAVTEISGMYFGITTPNSVFTTTNVFGIQIGGVNKGASHTITNYAGIAIGGAPTATNKTQLLLGTTSIPAGNFELYSSGTNPSLFTGVLQLGNLISKYNNINTVGNGIPSIYGNGRSVVQSAAVTSVATYTVGSSDGSFIVSANVLVTAYTAGTFTVTCAYTDESNAARTLTLNFSNTAGTLGINIAAVGPFNGIPLHIRCKASTAITIATTGTFTTLTYNVEAVIQQVV